MSTRSRCELGVGGANSHSHCITRVSLAVSSDCNGAWEHKRGHHHTMPPTPKNSVANPTLLAMLIATRRPIMTARITTATISIEITHDSLDINNTSTR